MRLIGLGVMATLAMMAGTLPASAAWMEYVYADLGVAKEFPAEPKVTTGTYKTPVAGTATSHIFSVDEPDAKYSMTVVDLMDKADRGSSIQGECVFLAESQGKATIANMPSRIEPGPAAVYGRIISEDLKDGSRALTECFYTKGHLYKLVADILPSNPDFPSSAEGVRFVNSLRFNLKNEPAAACPADEAPAAEGGARPARGGRARGGDAAGAGGGE
jgi:hypothetical protein